MTDYDDPADDLADDLAALDTPSPPVRESVSADDPARWGRCGKEVDAGFCVMHHGHGGDCNDGGVGASLRSLLLPDEPSCPSCDDTGIVKAPLYHALREGHTCQDCKLGTAMAVALRHIRDEFDTVRIEPRA